MISIIPWVHKFLMPLLAKLTMLDQTFKSSQNKQRVYSNFTCTHYVTLHVKIGLRKVKACWFGSAKWFPPSNFGHFAKAGKMAGQSLTPAREECISKTG
jgi:hypothetical protein